MFWLRSDPAWIARATRSLPVPLSPVIEHGQVVPLQTLDLIAHALHRAARAHEPGDQRFELAFERDAAAPRAFARGPDRARIPGGGPRTACAGAAGPPGASWPGHRHHEMTGPLRASVRSPPSRSAGRRRRCCRAAPRRRATSRHRRRIRPSRARARARAGPSMTMAAAVPSQASSTAARPRAPGARASPRHPRDAAPAHRRRPPAGRCNRRSRRARPVRAPFGLCQVRSGAECLEDAARIGQMTDRPRARAGAGRPAVPAPGG